MRRGFPGADETSLFNTGSGRCCGPGVRHHHGHPLDHADRVPALLVRRRVGSMGHERIVEHELRRLKAQAMLLRVDAVLVFVPCPAQRSSPV